MSRRPEWWLTILAKIWPITWISAKATKWPVAGPLITKLAVPMFSKKNLNITYIPINETMDTPESIPMHRAVIEELVMRSSHRVIINRCTCRDAKSCSSHPVEYGCMLMGEGTKEIDPRIARHVSKEEALAHLDRAVADGLIPMTGRVRIDNFIWGVRDRGRLLTVCFCCRCCCTLLQSGKYLPAEASSSIVPLEGVSISVDVNRCTLCGTCEKECFMGAIKIAGRRPVHDSGTCKGCGRCAAVCPESAVKIVLPDPQAAADELLGRIDGIIDYR